MKTICVFCGSANSKDDAINKAAYHFGKMLAQNRIDIVYGGAKVGIMGSVADGAIDNNGKVIGILPRFFKEKEIAHDQITSLILVESMDERKLKMIEMSDAFVVLPGGYGTFDELFEVLTLAQLGKFRKPLGFYNINNFFNPLLKMFDNMLDFGFISKTHQKLYVQAESPEQLLHLLTNFQAPELKKWVH